MLRRVGRPAGQIGFGEALANMLTIALVVMAVLLLVGVEDFSYDEAARILDLPLGTVMSRLSRARRALRSIVDGGRLPLLRRVK